MKVTLKEIEAALRQIRKSLEADGLVEIELTKDFYQWIQPEGFHSLPDLELESVTIGQASFDLETLRGINDGSVEASVSDLSVLAALLLSIRCELLPPM